MVVRPSKILRTFLTQVPFPPLYNVQLPTFSRIQLYHACKEQNHAPIRIAKCRNLDYALMN